MKSKEFLKNHKRKIIVGAPIIFLLLINSTSALSGGNVFLFGTANSSFVAVGDGVPVELQISTKTPVNAVGGTVTFSPDILSVDSVTRSSSIIDLWSEEPLISNTLGTIHFSGGIVGTNVGTAGNHGEVFTINFRALKTGKISLALKSGELLANNGEGTNVVSGSNTLTIYVRSQGLPSPDVNGDGSLSISDINAVYIKSFRAYDEKYDVNGDKKVDWNDVKALITLL